MSLRRQLREVLIIGAGQAGYQTAASLRERGYQGRLTLLGREDALPYERPPLSKGYLQDGQQDRLWLRPASFYQRREIELVHANAVAVLRRRNAVRLGDGRILTYDHLVLATGSEPRTLSVPGAGLRGVRTLRTLRDATALREELAAARNVLVIGAGFVGLEFAAVARAAGREVTVVESANRALARAVSEPTAAHLVQRHREAGVELLFGRSVAALEGDRSGRVRAAVLTDGSRLPADLVLIGIGVAPGTELAEEAGLAVGGGIVTDAHLLTEDPCISAVGDCAAFPDPRSGALIRIESVQAATDHARLVAARLTGDPRAYTATPRFWSHQYTSTLQIAGLGTGHDAYAVTGDRPQSFSVLLFRRDELVAVESLDCPADHMAARKLLESGTPVTRRQAAEDGFTLKRSPTQRAEDRVFTPA